MINLYEVTETNKMIEQEQLDVRTITMGINLLDCAGPDLAEVNEKIYNKITTLAKNLVSTGEEIAKEFGVPIVNKRISITPISLVGSSACKGISAKAVIKVPAAKLSAYQKLLKGKGQKSSVKITK